MIDQLPTTAHLPNASDSSQPGQTVAELISDMRYLATTLDSFALSFTLAWTQHPDCQRQSPSVVPSSEPERTEP